MQMYVYKLITVNNITKLIRNVCVCINVQIKLILIIYKIII